MNIYSINNIEIINEIILNNLEVIDNNYKSKLLLNNKDVLIKFPKCKIKSDLSLNNKILDLVYEKEENVLNKWITKFEEIIKKKIYKKNKIWFTNEISLNSISNMITPIYRKYKNKYLIRTYIDVDKNIDKNILHNNNEIIPVIKLDFLIVNSNSFDIKLNIFDIEKNLGKDNIKIDNNGIEEVNLIINNNETIKLKKRNELYEKYYRETILKANYLRNEAIKKYLEAKKIKLNIYNLDNEFIVNENEEIDKLNKEKFEMI